MKTILHAATVLIVILLSITGCQASTIPTSGTSIRPVDPNPSVTETTVPLPILTDVPASPSQTPAIATPWPTATATPIPLEEISVQNISGLQPIANLGGKQLDRFYYDKRQQQVLAVISNEWVKLSLQDFSLEKGPMPTGGTISIAPDFSRFVAEETEKASIWDEKGQLLTQIDPQEKVNFFEPPIFSPDTLYLAFPEFGYSPDGRMNILFSIYDASSGHFLFNTNTHSSSGLGFPFGQYTFSPDNSKFIYADENQNAVEIWDVQSRQIAATLGYGASCNKTYWYIPSIIQNSFTDLSTDSVSCLIFSPDGQSLIIATNSKNTVVDTKTWKAELDLPRGHPQYSADGRFLLLNDGYSASRVWEMSNRKMVYSSGNQAGLGFSPDSRYILYQEYQNQSSGISLLDLSAKKMVFRSMKFDQLTFAGNAEYVVASSSSEKHEPGQLIRSATGETVYTAPSNSCELFGTTQNSLVVSCNFGNFAWDLAANTVKGDLPSGRIIWIPGDQVFLIYDRNRLLVYDQATLQQVREVPFEPGLVFRPSGHAVNTPDQIKVHQNDLYIPGATGIQQWDLSTLTLSNSFPRGTSYSDNNQIRAVPSPDGVVIYDQEMKVATLPIPDANFGVLSPSGKYLAASRAGDGIDVWDISLQKLIRTFKGEPGRPFQDIAFSQDEQYIFADQYAKAQFYYYGWNLSTGARQFLKTAYRFMPLALSQDGTRLAVKDDFSNFQIFSITSSGIKAFKTVNFDLTTDIATPSAAFSADGKILAIPQWRSVGSTFGINFVRVETGETMFELIISNRYLETLSISFSADGKYFLVSGPEGIQVYGVLAK